MAERKDRDWPTLNTYVEGNTVRRLEPSVRTPYEPGTSPRKRRPAEEPARKPAVRQNAQPAEQPRRSPERTPARRPAEQPKIYREPKERTSRMTPVFALYTTAVLGILLFFAFRMLSAQTSLAAAAKDVTVLETTLNEINQENTKLQTLIRSGVDLEAIYRTATEELGLVSTDDSQVVYYDPIESGYVRQDEVIR